RYLRDQRGDMATVVEAVQDLARGHGDGGEVLHHLSLEVLIHLAPRGLGFNNRKGPREGDACERIEQCWDVHDAVFLEKPKEDTTGVGGYRHGCVAAGKGKAG